MFKTIPIHSTNLVSNLEITQDIKNTVKEIIIIIKNTKMNVKEFVLLI